MRDAVWNFVVSPEFLVGGLVFGFLVNLLSSYMKEGIDRKLAQYSANKKEKNEALAKRRQVRIQRMVVSDDELRLMRQSEIRMVSGTIAMLVLLCLVFNISILFKSLAPTSDEIRTPWEQYIVVVSTLVLMAYVMSKLVAYISSGKRLTDDIRQAIRLRQQATFTKDEDGRLIPKRS